MGRRYDSVRSVFYSSAARDRMACAVHGGNPAGPFRFFVRRYVEEPPIYLETRSKLEAVGVFAGIAYATMAIAAFLLPETKGKVLAAE